MTASLFFHNGVQASATALASVAFAGFAHFTALQTRGRAVRGLDLHLARLRSASETMFGTSLSDEKVAAHLRQAVTAGPADASVSVFVASRPGEFEAAGNASLLDVFVRVSDPATPPLGPVGLDVVEHERDLPQVKHVGEVAKTFHLRRAQRRGYDDALFVDSRRCVSEATIWNIVFWDGSRVVWPQAEILDGVTQQILRRQLTRAGIAQHTMPLPVDQIDPQWSAAIMNSWSPGIAISRLGDRLLSQNTRLVRILHDAYTAEELHPL